MTIYDEQYRVVAVESHRLVIRGILSGKVLIINTVPEFPLTEEAFPLGQLITLSDPFTEVSEPRTRKLTQTAQPCCRTQH